MAADGSPSPATPDKAQEVVDHVAQKVELSEPQKLVLKDKVKDKIARTTSLNIENFKNELAKELNAQKSATDESVNEIKDTEIGESVDKAEATVTTPPAPSNSADALLASPILGSVVGEERATSIRENISQSWGIWKAIAKFIYDLIAAITGKKLSYEQNETFHAEIAPILQEMGIDTEKNAKVAEVTMSTLWKLGIPLELGATFFKFIKDPESSINKIPEKSRRVFEAGRANYQEIKANLNEDPVVAIQQILDFEVPDAPVVPTGPAAAPTESAPVAPVIEAIKFKNGDKEIALEATPESVTSFRKIQKTAETILGKEKVDMEKILQEAYKANTETDPKKKWEAVLKSVAIELAKRIRDTTAILWWDPLKEVTAKDGKKISLSDDSFTGDLLPAIDAKLQAYIPLAFKELSNQVSEKVKILLTDLESKVSWLTPEDYEKIRGKIKTSVIGSYTEAWQINAAPFAERTKTGYNDVMRDIIKQAEKLQAINPAEFNKTVLILFQEKSPLELS